MIWLFTGVLLLSLFTSWLGCWILRRGASRLGLIDRPGGHKAHERPMPSGGGIAIALGVLLPLGLLQAAVSAAEAGLIGERGLPAPLRAHLAGIAAQLPRLWILITAALALLVLGLVDDLRGVSWKLRLLGEVLVAGILVTAWEGWRLTAFIDLPILTAMLSILWIVALVNAFNMLDNMDGLSAGVAAIAAAVLAAAMLLFPDPQTGQPQLFVGGLLLVLLGSLLGFLGHNHPPARLFMGDAGSYWIGFLLGSITLMATFASQSLPRHTILAPLCALAVPLYDLVSVILIRLWAGRSPFAADRSHFSHRLVELGLSRTHAVWTIYLATLVCGLGALLLREVSSFGAAVVMAMVLGVLAMIAILETAARRHGGDRSTADGALSETGSIADGEEVSSSSGQ